MLVIIISPRRKPGGDHVVGRVCVSEVILHTTHPSTKYFLCIFMSVLKDLSWLLQFTTFESLYGTGLVAQYIFRCTVSHLVMLLGQSNLCIPISVAVQ